MVAQLIESSPVEPLVVGVHLFPGDTWFREVRVVSTTSQQPVDLSAWVFEAKLGDGVGTVDASRAAEGILSVTFAPSVTASAKRGTQLTIAGALAGGRRTFVVGRVGAEVGSSIPVGLVQRKRVVQTDVDISVYAAPRGDKGADGTAISRALVEQVQADRSAAGSSAFNAGASAAAAQSSEEEAQRAEVVAIEKAEQARVYAAGTVALQDAAVGGVIESGPIARAKLFGAVADAPAVTRKSDLSILRRTLVPNPGATIGPRFVKVPGPVVKASDTTLPSIYWPSVVRVDGIIPNSPWKFYMAVSTDHGGAGGVGMLGSNDLIAWTWLGVKFTDRTSGTQTETGSLIANHIKGTIDLYYQQVAPAGAVASQATCLATSTDMETWTRFGIVIDVKSLGDTNISAHTGYARPHLINNTFVTLHLADGGDYSRKAVSYSNDGRRYRMDPRLIEPSPHQASDTLRRVFLNEVFQWDGEMWGVGIEKYQASGSAPTDSTIVIGRVTRDLKHFAEVPRPAITLGEQPWESANVRSHHVFADGGRLYLFYQTDNNIGLAVSEATS